VKRFVIAVLLGFRGVAGFAQTSDAQARTEAKARRIVVLKIDGLTGDLLYRTMREVDPVTGKSRLPWVSHIFAENGVVFENFYTRGISLSAPSWSMLDTGHHTVIRGNVEYDRYTGRVYDYLNFFPFYIGYARSRQVDMPGVEVLDRAGIPLVLDAFPYDQGYQGFQLFQRGVRWSTFKRVLTRRVKSELFLSPVESVGAPPMDSLIGQQMESELKNCAEQPDVFYLDLFSPDADHTGHATNQQAALIDVLRHLDGLAGRIWTAVEKGPLARQTIFVVVSDHGMNNRPDVFSQSYSLPDFFSSPAGGAHHVVTNRHQLDSYKIMGLDPLVQRVVTPSTASFYLSGKGSSYPTAWLDLDGNERAAVHLRNNDLNKIHILLLQLMRTDLTAEVRQAAVAYLLATIERHRAAWTVIVSEMDEELTALQSVIDRRKVEVKGFPHRWSAAQKEKGTDKESRRESRDLELWEQEHASYSAFLKHLRALMALYPDANRPFGGNVENYLPEMELGDNNSVGDVQHYAVGPGPSGLVVDANGKLDEERSFRFVNYFPLLVQQRVRNNPQSALPVHPVDFIAMRLLDGSVSSHGSGATHGYWLYGNESSQIMILTDTAGRIALRPVSRLQTDPKNQIQWTAQEWRAGLPLHLFEDANLYLPPGADRARWLSDWHTDREWLAATHQCRYSNGVIGITEELSPVEDNVPALPNRSPVLLRYERRRRALVSADFHVFAADGWNFNARSFNPGGNHGGFFRISTQSVWMMAGSGLPKLQVTEPYDSLNFASTILHLAGKPAPMPDRIVRLP
jgi:hypothetical protein